MSPNKPHYAIRRRSSRIGVELPIQISGTDSNGRGFAVQTQTQLLSRHGAKISLQEGLVPDQEIIIHCPALKKDAEARVVALFRKESGGYVYGIEFLDPKADFWNVPFPADPWEK